MEILYYAFLMVDSRFFNNITQEVDTLLYNS